MNSPRRLSSLADVGGAAQQPAYDPGPAWPRHRSSPYRRVSSCASGLLHRRRARCRGRGLADRRSQPAQRRACGRPQSAEWSLHPDRARRVGDADEGDRQHRARMRCCLGHLDDGTRFSLRDPREEEIGRRLSGASTPSDVVAALLRCQTSSPTSCATIRSGRMRSIPALAG